AGPEDVQGRFLLGRLEGPLLLEFVLQLRGRHGAGPFLFDHLQLVYIATIVMSSEKQERSRKTPARASTSQGTRSTPTEPDGRTGPAFGLTQRHHPMAAATSASSLRSSRAATASA